MVSIISIVNSHKYFSPYFLGHWNEFIPSKLLPPEENADLGFEEKEYASFCV